MRKGTPRNGPSGSPSRAARRPRSNIGWITALSRGFSSSMRAIAASTSSAAETFPLRTSSARPRASNDGYSVKLMARGKDVAMLVLDQETLGGVDPLLELHHPATHPFELGH